MTDLRHSIDTCGFAQIGDPQYKEKAFVEIYVMIYDILKGCGKPPKYCKFNIEKCQHEAGSYYEPVLVGTEMAADGSFWNYVNKIDNHVSNIEIETHEKMQEYFDILHNTLDDDMFELSMQFELDEKDLEAMHGKTIYELAEEGAFNGIMHTLCPLGCQVEPDGKCSHGFESLALKLGII